MKAAWAVVGALLGGAAVFVAIKPTDRVVHAVPARANDTRPLIVNAGTRAENVDLDALRDDIRRAIRDELGTTAATKDESSSDRAPTPRSDAQAAALATAHDAISLAITSGRWTLEDNERMRPLGRELDAQAVEELLSAWTIAVNRQELRPDVQLVF